MALASESAKDIARLGANITISDTAGYTSESVKDIIRIATGNGNRVTVYAAKYTSESVKDFVRLGNGLVTIHI